MKQKELKILCLQLKALTIFRDLKQHPIIYSLLDVLESLNCEDGEYILEMYSALCAEIYESGGDLAGFIKDYIKTGDNLYVEKHLVGGVTPEMERALSGELDVLQKLSRLSSEDILNAMKEMNAELERIALPTWNNSKIMAKKEFDAMIKTLDTKGYGIFADSKMFKVRDGELVPIKKADYQTLDQLYGYDRERNMVLRNTESLASGKTASNVLLYGDAGTGKSTTVKACAAHYASKGVRLIEFDKKQVQEIPGFAEKLSNSPLKFIFFIDDLTFTKNDDDYYALKGILEGNVSGTSPNILIYATSNRRHLVKESMADREGDDLHLNDTLQETMSLSSRFGLTITFSKPAKDLYLSIVENMAMEQGLLSSGKAKSKGSREKQLEDLLTRAEAFAIRANGRSPRTAKQFIVLAKNNLA